MDFEKKMSPKSATLGLVVLNSLLIPIWSNFQALEILAYTNGQQKKGAKDILLPKEVQTGLSGQKASLNFSITTEFVSGKRGYVCHALSLNPTSKNALQPFIGLLLERKLHPKNHLPHIVKKFHLTPREGETVKNLLEGFSNKEIANRMNVSPNTVKAFLRLIMTKMGTTSRTGIFGKILGR